MQNQSEGFIMLHRSLLEWEHFREPSVLQVWITILLKCNWKDAMWKGKKIKRGEWITSQSVIHEFTGLSFPTIMKALRTLESTKEIKMETTPKYTFIKVSKFNDYQCLTDDTYKNNLQQDLQQDLQPTLHNRIKKINNTIDDVDEVKSEEIKACFKAPNFIETENIPLYLINNTPTDWKERCMREFKCNKFDLTGMFDEYMNELLLQNVKMENENDIQPHFVNLMRKKFAKVGGKRINKTTEQSSRIDEFAVALFNN